MVKASAALAPAVKPSNPGSAKGFLVTPCMIEPETAKEAPTNTAAITRGNLISFSITTVSLTLLDIIAFHESFIVVSAAPKTIEIKNELISTKIPIRNL
ncbi:hypothetical protein GCM10011351_25330 [Paraliobacillus quinghaiensis]|uniref:Uncharacterized protein n=1 Tax=Paraliobacillus quinghaiensis TaxID=470815 RepID=A0A917WXM4_9BACI|nr:hypothetical protein GCM10011351_25330 [Paraliobacillus quinghaiensis]